MTADAVDDVALVDALGSSQRVGMLGRRPVGEVIEHAMAFVGALRSTSGTVLDLGSGGGVPGLVIARARPDLSVVLVDRRATRTDHLRRLVRRLGLEQRVAVVTAEASTLVDGPPVDAVVARSFGPPTATVRAAAPLVRIGGLIVVSEPPATPADRWPASVLDDLGLVRTATADTRVACFTRHHVSRET